VSEVEREEQNVSAVVRERRRRSDAGEVRGTARDVELLPWVVEMEGMPVDLLARKAGTSEGAVRNLLARWRRAGWVESGRVDAGPSWCWATKEGVMRFGRAEYVVRPPSTARAAHIRAVIVARMQLEQAAPELQWKSERELRFGAGGVGRSGHVPDAVLTLPIRSGEMTTETALEVELTRKPAARIKGIMTEILSSRESGGLGFTGVLYLAPAELLPVLERVRESLGAASNRVTVRELVI